mgnify:FL=1|tara:strand:+ start:1561 stop:1884 length:324 start_codon:yes stop_codon:yes gene_type:complete
MAVSLTSSAAERIRTYIDKRENCLGLRLGVTVTGCSGYSYVINYAEEISNTDTVFENKGITIVVESDILKLIDGTKVDFVKDGLNESFKFQNPNITGECGCGESFSI